MTLSDLFFDDTPDFQEKDFCATAFQTLPIGSELQREFGLNCLCSMISLRSIK